MSSPEPNAQRRVPLATPVLPRLLFLHTHLLKWIWLGLYLVGLALMLYLSWMGQAYRIELNHMLPQSFTGLTGCFLIVAICLLYAGEKEERLHEFALHRGWNPWAIHRSKISLSLTLYFALLAALYLSRTILLWLARINNETTFTTDDFVWAIYTPLLFLAWSLFGSHLANNLLNAIAITFTGLLTQVAIVAFGTGEDNFPGMIIVNALLIGTLWIASRPEIADFLRYLAQDFAIWRPDASLLGHAPSFPATEHLPREQTLRRHLNWLHARQSRLRLILGSGIVPLAFAIPYVIDHGQAAEGFAVTLIGSIIPIYLFSAPLLVFQPEHARTSYRFWNDRGLPWQAVLRSRLLGFLVPHVILAILTGLALFLGFWMILNVGVTGFTLSEAISIIDRELSKDAQNVEIFWTGFTLLLPVATSTALFYSWTFRSVLVAFVIQLLTMIALLFCAAVFYGHLDIPLWLIFGPLVATLAYLILSRFPQRFQLEIPTRFYRTNTFAIIAAFALTLTGTAFYRVLQVPDVGQDLAPQSQVWWNTTATSPLRGSELLTAANPEFQNRYDAILKRLTPFPQHELTLLQHAGLHSYHNHLVGNFGFAYAHPRIQTWAIDFQQDAQELKDLFLNTPLNQISVAWNTFLGDAQQLLLYSAKYRESIGDLETASEFYIAHNRLLELFAWTLNGDPFRSHLHVAVTSWLNHPSQPLANRDEFLLKMTTQPDDALDPRAKILNFVEQMKNHYAPPLLVSSDQPWPSPEHWTSYFTVLPTERARLQRLFTLWGKIQLMEHVLYTYFFLPNREPVIVVTRGQADLMTEYLREAGQLYEQLRQTTPELPDGSNPLRPWYPEQLQTLKGRARHHALSHAYLVLILAHTDLGFKPQPETNAVADSLQKLRTQTPLSPRLAAHLETELRSRDLTIAQNGLRPINPQPIEGHYNLETIGQKLLILVTSTNPPIYPGTDERGPFLRVPSPYLTLPNLNNPPPIPDYDALAKLTPNELLAHFRKLAGFVDTPPAPPLPEEAPPDPFFGLDKR